MRNIGSDTADAAIKHAPYVIEALELSREDRLQAPTSDTGVCEILVSRDPLNSYLLAVEPLGTMIIFVLVVAVWGRFGAKVGPTTPLNKSGSKNGAELT